MTKEKTHWLQNPNKNYLGHQDLPNGKDVILTIDTAEWEAVENPRTKKSDDKRVVKFQERYSWLKPFIINETNAANILKSTGEKYMEDCTDKRINITISQTPLMGEVVDCLRVSDKKQSELPPETISHKLRDNIERLFEEANMDKVEFCELMKISAISELPTYKYNKVILRLSQKKEENANN